MNIFFNSSMPRSGSELLQVILHQNPAIYGSSTSPLLEYQFGARANFDLPEVKSQSPQMMLEAFLSMCKSMADGYYSAITDRPNVIDKNRGWTHYYEWVNQWNPNPKMVCMVRDLRDIFASMERVFRSNRHSPQGIDNPAQLVNMTTEQRVNHWSTTQPIGLAIQRLRDNFERNISQNILFVRYEDLCDDPKKTMDRVYRYLELEPFDHDFLNIEKKVYEDDSHFGIFGSHSVVKALKPYSPGGWRSVLPDYLGEQINASFQWYCQEFNYS